MNKKRTEHGFTEVDSYEDPRSWVRCLDTLHKEPFYIAYKARIAQLLEPQTGGTYLDIGAGTGDDARAMAKTVQTTVVAIDHSKTMMSEVTHGGLDTSVVGCATCLPFTDNSFDGCWSDRTFQHLVDSVQALAEIGHVTKPRGRIVVVDPDYDTQVLEFPDQELARRVLRYRAERGLRNGALAHHMPAMFSDAGLCQVTVETVTLVVRDHTAVDNVMGLRSWSRAARSSGYLSDHDVTRWERLFDKTVAARRFMYAVTFFLTAGTKP